MDCFYCTGEKQGLIRQQYPPIVAYLGSAGMRWSRPGLERLLPIRAAIMSRYFDQLWQRAHKSPQK
jgi:hypothetical protein